MYEGCMMSALNSMTQRGKDSVAAYDISFGMPCGGAEQCSHEDLLRCNTIEDRLQLVKCPWFENVAHLLCDI